MPKHRKSASASPKTAELNGLALFPWRIGLQDRFPEDPRNFIAVEMLKKFSVDADNMTDGQFAKLKPHFSWIDDHWHDVLKMTVRRVGYQRVITSFDSFVNSLVFYILRAKAATTQNGGLQ